MIELAQVQAVLDRRITVQKNIGAGCFGCMNRECRTNRGFVAVENPEDLPVQVGQMVKVEYPPAKARLVQGSVALSPVLLFIAGYFVGGLAGLPEGPRIGGAFLALILSALILLGFRRKHPPQSVPRLVA
ncbi:MAG: SoxR reducing system RseC family protein [Treponema sp.]|jgi:positive regulator of sigma E activity|nr:SoxR reducing system RseC family protein [Treponema sp.]